MMSYVRNGDDDDDYDDYKSHQIAIHIHSSVVCHHFKLFKVISCWSSFIICRYGYIPLTDWLVNGCMDDGLIDYS